MRELVETVVSLVATSTLTYAVIAYDERHLTPEELARAYPPATRLNACFGVLLGPHVLLALPVHFARTRRRILARLLGLVFGALVIGGTIAAEFATDRICDALDIE